nr:hypothetical protein [Paludibacteraceae bacterium]
MQESPKGVSESCTDFCGNEEAKEERKVKVRRKKYEVRGRMASGTTAKKESDSNRGKDGKK